MRERTPGYVWSTVFDVHLGSLVGAGGLVLPLATAAYNAHPIAGCPPPLQAAIVGAGGVALAYAAQKLIWDRLDGSQRCILGIGLLFVGGVGYIALGAQAQGNPWLTLAALSGTVATGLTFATKLFSHDHVLRDDFYNSGR